MYVTLFKQHIKRRSAFMTETLWISLPSNEENVLKEVINSIISKNLTNLSINQLIDKIEHDQAPRWFEVIRQYNSIPSVNNIESFEMLDRTKSVKRKFRECGYDQLENREFQPNELLSLIILCYSNPNLIGPKLCKALNDNNVDNIKKEILENSARVGNRLAPWASNLRLANYALYANDTSIKLPVNTINRVKNETIQKGLIVIIKDFQGGFEEVVDGPRRVSRRERAVKSEIDTYAVLQSSQSSEESFLLNGQFQEVVSPLISEQVNHSEHGSQLTSGSSVPLNGTSNAAIVSNVSSMLLVSGLALFHVTNQIPVVGPVMRNICKDAKNAISFMGNVLSKDETEHSDQIEEKAPLLSSIAKP
jgi:hypothetical protein